MPGLLYDPHNVPSAVRGDVRYGFGVCLNCGRGVGAVGDPCPFCNRACVTCDKPCTVVVLKKDGSDGWGTPFCGDHAPARIVDGEPDD